MRVSSSSAAAAQPATPAPAVSSPAALQTSSDPADKKRMETATPLQDFDAFVPHDALFAGQSDPEVGQLQTILTTLGLLSTADAAHEANTLGPKTQAALHKFQEKNQLSANLLYGPETWSALETAVNEKAYPDVPANDLAPGASGPDVKQLQRALVTSKVMTQADADAESGTFGDRTEAALTSLQRQYGLMSSGIYSGLARVTLEQLVARAEGKSSTLDLPQPGVELDDEPADFGLYPITGGLTVGDPSPQDVSQGMAGDCYFDSAVGSIANVDPEAVKKMVKDNGDGTFTFTFQTYNERTHGYDPTPITVDSNLYAMPNKDGSLAPVYDQDPGADWDVKDGKMNQMLLPLFEKAFAQFQGGSYDKIGRGGFSSQVFEALLGRPGYYICLGAEKDGGVSEDKAWDIIQKGVASHTPLVAGTKQADDKDPAFAAAGVIPGHAYMLLGAKVENGQRMVELRNPWGYRADSDPKGDASFWLPLDDMLKYYDDLEVSPAPGTDLGFVPNDDANLIYQF